MLSKLPTCFISRWTHSWRMNQLFYNIFNPMENLFSRDVFERAQEEYEARSRTWIWLDKFTSYVIKWVIRKELHNDITHNVSELMLFHSSWQPENLSIGEFREFRFMNIPRYDNPFRLPRWWTGCYLRTVVKYTDRKCINLLTRHFLNLMNFRWVPKNYWKNNSYGLL